MDIDRQEQLDAFRTLFTRVGENEYAAFCSPSWWQGFFAQYNPSDADSSWALPFTSYHHYVNKILTPGIPGAVLPVESIYKDWGGAYEGMAHMRGMYLGSSAQHIIALCRQLEIEVPKDFSAMPDHLVVLLELAEFLRCNASEKDYTSFVDNHFDWLALYKDALVQRMRTENDSALVQTNNAYLCVLDAIEDFVHVSNGVLQT